MRTIFVSLPGKRCQECAEVARMDGLCPYHFGRKLAADACRTAGVTR